MTGKIKPVMAAIVGGGLALGAFTLLLDGSSDSPPAPHPAAASDSGTTEAWKQASDAERKAVEPPDFPQDEGVPVFRETFEQLRDAYNRRLDDDTADNDKNTPHKATIKKCTKDLSVIKCDFYDQSFKYSLKGLRELGAVKGNPHYQAAMLFKLSKHGKVASALLFGGRSDPVNSMMFYSNVVDFAEIWNSDRDAAVEKADFADHLGIMRDTTKHPAVIPGEVTTLKRPYVTINCIPVPDDDGAPAMCAFLPPSAQSGSGGG
ncbi:hypothetical protein [Acetobacter sicerae]|uniref:hypothetical protein n=1 Tax=Acetobacter sicerae TaxID=85325 RepID=UPI00156B0FF2|nr:hypothetical protein [Acetobacter sicerae]NHN93635.1 hypothetical protein [Acetobacter sicerae]